ncbi:hypothetical protein HZA71_02440 [Candidatus Falkowbacteria bacterium]|nr:hypothetical protein [Candidatus Falkowbacteria bacterium]
MFEQKNSNLNPVFPDDNIIPNQPDATSPISFPSPAPQSHLPQPPVEDIFAETDKGNPQVIRPLQPGQVQNILPDSAAPDDLFGGRSIWQNKLLVIILMAAGILILGGVGWLTFSFFAKSGKPNSSPNQNINNNNAAANVNNVNTANVNNVNNNADVVNNANINQAAVAIDSDNDGLTDEEERKLGTDPNNFDSDNDGLTDSAEVKIYKTDPLNPDTDGDGYKDGPEVSNGYDPTKPGGARLFNVPKQ